jgi:hypothetical protein
MWNMKRFVIPVIIGATGTVAKGIKISVTSTRKAISIFPPPQKKLYYGYHT